MTDTSTAEPVVNFIVYVPDKAYSPLLILGKEKKNEGLDTNELLVMLQKSVFEMLLSPLSGVVL